MKSLKLLAPVSLCILFTLLLTACGATGGSGTATIESRLTPGRILDDSLLKTAINRAILAETQRRRSRVTIKTVVLDGRVFIFGSVPDQGLKETISSIAADFRHTRSVHNELFIGDVQSSGGNRSDRGIMNRAVRSLSVDPRTRDADLDINVFNGHVYLMGIVTRSAGEAATDLVKYIEGVSTVIVLLDYLD